VCVHLSVYLFLCATFHGCHFDLLHSQFGNCFGPTRWTYLRFAGLCNLSILICTRSLAFFASECIQFNLTAAQQRKLKNTNILLEAKYRGTRSHYVWSFCSTDCVYTSHVREDRLPLVRKLHISYVLHVRKLHLQNAVFGDALILCSH